MKTIKLQLYKGKKLLYNKFGKVENEHQIIKISDGAEWFNYLKYIKAQGLCQVDFISVTENGKEVKDVSLWVKQLKEACEPVIEVVLPELPKEKKEDVQDDKKVIREALKAKLDELKISYPKTASNEKLQELIDNATKE